MRARLRESLERLHALAFQQTVAVHKTDVIPDALFLDLPGFANQLRGRGTLHATALLQGAGLDQLLPVQTPLLGEDLVFLW